MKNILVLGGSGFIGRALCERLSHAGHTVTSFSNFSAPYSQKIKFIAGDFTSEHDRINLARDQYDVIYHLISTSGPSDSEENYGNEIQQNLISTLNFLSHLKNKENLKFIFVSSGGAIYGNQAQTLSETTLPTPLSSYGVIKLAIERYLSIFSSRYGMHTVVFRPTNPFGPWPKNLPPFGFINNFLLKSLKNEDFTLLGNGNTSRDFIFIDDLIDALACGLEIQCRFEIFNVSSGKQNTLKEIIALCHELGILPKRIVTEPARYFDAAKTNVTSEKLLKATLWQPKTDLNTGIQLTSDFIRAHLLEK